jgi:hypothetical protein
MAGSFDFTAASFVPLPVKIGLPVLSAQTSLSASVLAQPGVVLKTNRIGVQIRPFGTGTYDAGVRFVLEVSFDGGSNYMPYKTYSSVVGIHSTAVTGQTAGMADMVDVQATHARMTSYAWGSTTAGIGANVRLLA